MDVAEIAKEWDATLDKLRDKLEEFQALDQRAHQEISKAIEKFPFQGPILRKGYEEIVELKGRIEKELIRMTTKPGNPAALAVAAEKWQTEISKKLAPLIFRINGENDAGEAFVDADIYWDGPSARKYGKVAARQVEGLRSLAGTADTMQTGLVTIAWAVISFWVALIAATYQAIIAFIAGLATVETGWGAAVAAGALVVFVTILAALATATIALLGAFDTFETALEQNSEDKATFGDDVSWPAVPDLSSDW